MNSDTKKKTKKAPRGKAKKAHRKTDRSKTRKRPSADAVTLLSEDDLYLFGEGTHHRLYEALGAHPGSVEGKAGTWFAVWAPNAEAVFVRGDFNGWSDSSHPLRPRAASGVWEGFIPGVGSGSLYKYHIVSKRDGYRVDKADPFAFFGESPPEKASIVRELAYEWSDGEWMAARGGRSRLSDPIAVYEVHIGSWRRNPKEGGRLTYQELARELPEYVSRMGFTHVELLPVMEHPFYGSWGYQTTGFFAPTSRYGTPQDFMALIDRLHQHGIGVILDWVPSHFPSDEHSIGYFDGTHLYEHADPRRRVHPDWDSLLFDYSRGEVCSFLASSALFWLDKYHIDGLRVDAVASMLHLDFSRKEGEWVPNEYGGRENLDAIAFLKRLNEVVYENYPDVQTYAEESSAWPLVSRPVENGGLGFGMKWDMGWMNDTLDYMAKDPIHRKHHHDRLTFRILYAWSENFLLPLSHDEVVYGKRSLLEKMPGDEWQKFANLRLLLALQYAQPGKKLLFMGGEFGQRNEWYHEAGLDWHLLDQPEHAGVQRLVQDLNGLYRREPALHERDVEEAGFEWVDCSDSAQSVISFLRKGSSTEDEVLVVCNFTPLPRHGYPVGVPRAGRWEEVLNSDAAEYGGSGIGNLGGVEAETRPIHDRPCRLDLTLPPLGAVFLK